MSGIAAIVTRDGRPAPADDVLAMLDAIPYRGPDGAFARRYGRAVLGHARMITTATDRAESQPLTSQRTGCAIVADIRLDNREQLRAKLSDPPPVGASDAHLVLCAYEHWGIEAPKHLLGDFAFAIWDQRQQRLVCARDGAGQRTLFYRQDARAFAVASEIHQLLQDPSVEIAPDDERIFSALLPTNLFRNEKEQARTFYKGISSLLPGHVLVLERGWLQIHRFRQLTPPTPIRYRTDAEYVEHFRELLFQVVADRLKAAGPVGLLLSGGLDSGSIACVAQELYRAGAAVDTGFQAFSTVYDGLECDERPLIEEVQARFGFKAHYLAPDSSQEARQLEPGGFRHTPRLPTTGLGTMFDATARAGSRVLLTGEVADSVLRGTPLVLDSLLRQGKLGAFGRYLRVHRTATGDPLHKTLTLYAAAPLLPLSLQKRLMSAYAARHVDRDRWRLLPAWMPGGLRDALFESNRELLLARESQRTFANETKHLLQLNLDPPETPAIPFGWPIEIWRPYADRRLHEFVMAVPPEQLFAPVANDPWCYGGSKQLLRRSMHGLLPESIRSRTQPTQFNQTVGDELDQQWSLHEAVFGPTGSSEVAARGYVEPSRFWTRLQDLRAGRAGADFLYIHYVIGLETWLRGLRRSRGHITTVSTRVISPPAVFSDNGAIGVSPHVLHASTSRRDVAFSHFSLGRR